MSRPLDRVVVSLALGAAVAVVAGNRVVHARGFGAADDTGRRVTAQTPFQLGSTTKSFTALAMMQLVDAGKVRLDAPVRRYVPELRLADGAADRITVRHVLQHTSGLPLNTSGGPILKSAWAGTPVEAIGELRDQAPVSTPGAAMEYVNANYVLAGLVVERASGEPYGRYVERHIFAPLEMTHSFAAPGPARRAGLAAGHRYLFGVTDTTWPRPRPGTLATGYLMSSAADMARYLAVYLGDGVGLNGRRIVSAAGMRTLLTPGRPTTHLGPWADAAEARYAMGWFVGGPWDEPAILHPGDTVGSSSLIVLLPRRDLAVVALVNASNELAVPANPAAIPRMMRNAVDVLIGAPVDTGTSVRRFYAIFDAVVALLLAAALVGLVRALRALRHARPPRHRLRAATGIPIRAAIALLVLSYPVLVGYGWTAMRYWHPDLALVSAAVGVTVLATALVRLVWVVRARSGRRATSPGRVRDEDAAPAESLPGAA